MNFPSFGTPSAQPNFMRQAGGFIPQSAGQMFGSAGSLPLGQDPALLGQGLGVDPQMGMLNGLMQMLMQSIGQMAQGLQGYGQDGALASLAQPQFGGGGGGIGGGGGGSRGGGNGGLNQFLGGGGSPRGGGGGSVGGGGGGTVASVASNATGSTTQGAGATADLPDGVKGLTFEKAAELVKKGGGEMNPNGRPTVLALRTKTKATSTYDDVYVVLKKDGTMENFKGSTQPTSSGKDRAILKPGAYNITPRWRDGKYNNDAFLVQTKSGSNNVGVGRDSNGDGVYSDGEMNANTSSDLIRLHRGNSNSTSSTGCLNVQNYDGFLQSVGGKDSNFNLVVVTI